MIWQSRVTGLVRQLSASCSCSAGALVLFTMPFWLSILAYRAYGGGALISSSNLIATGSLIDHARISNSLSSFAGLFHLNTIVQWPSMDRSKAFDGPL